MWQKVAKFKGTEYFRKALYAENCGLKQMVNDTTRSSTKLGHRSDSIDLIFCNIPLQCLKSRSMPVGWTDHGYGHNIMNTKVPKKPPMAKVLAANSKLEIDEQNYRTLRNYAVKLNRKGKKVILQQCFN